MLTPNDIVRVVTTYVFADERARVSRMAGVAAEARRMVDVLETEFATCLGGDPNAPADVIADAERELAAVRDTAAEFEAAHAAAARQLALAEATRREMQSHFDIGFQRGFDREANTACAGAVFRAASAPRQSASGDTNPDSRRPASYPARPAPLPKRI